MVRYMYSYSLFNQNKQMPVLANVIEITTDYLDLPVMYATITCIIYVTNCFNHPVRTQKIETIQIK